MGGYNYDEQRSWLFTDEGQVALIKARDNAIRIAKAAGGAFVGMKALEGVKVGDTWKMLAILDRLVEMVDMAEVPEHDVWSQDKIYRLPSTPG